ncbi:retinoid-inducible serine carboxypeptidase-like [Tubulanus polymorphus]|uniref:retinoid-inducible serine carboxypeptidase-like n=1 Tax=Tubulanus polymorphus TaxID=672921 RepID=UPI003DA21365
MNDKIKHLLKIPDQAGIWNEATMFVNLALSISDTMIPVDGEVEYLLNNTNVNVTVYNGQLDFVITCLGTEKWMSTLKWSNITNFLNTPRKPLMKTPNPVAFVRRYDKLSMYWILNSGHEVPADNPYAAELMLLDIFEGDF